MRHLSTKFCENRLSTDRKLINAHENITSLMAVTKIDALGVRKPLRQGVEPTVGVFQHCPYPSMEKFRLKNPGSAS